MRRPTGYRFPLAIGSHLCDGTRKKNKKKTKNWTRKKFTACRSWALCGINAWEISYLHWARQFQSATLTYCGNLYSAPPPLQLNTRQPSASLQLSPCSVAAAGFVIYLRHDRDIIAKSSYALCIYGLKKIRDLWRFDAFRKIFWLLARDKMRK